MAEYIDTTRPGWTQYFMEFAELTATRSMCMRRKVGAVLVRDHHILSTGYNGAPTGEHHCFTVGCIREQQNIPSGERAELCRGLHAEQNAIIQAAINGVGTRGAVLYCTNSPCFICAKMIVQAGIAQVVFKNYYDDERALGLLYTKLLQYNTTDHSAYLIHLVGLKKGVKND